MKPFLVDVPVKINIWIRPQCQKKQFDVIKKARPSILFIQSDGGRTDEERVIIKSNREMIDQSIDWDCKVFRLYEKDNQGLYSMGMKMREYIWNEVDRCIFFEDDQIPAISYFRFCEELLEKYKDDERIECICGFNNLGKWEKASSDYFFSRQGSVWGVAMWKRTHDSYNDFSYGKDPYIMGLLHELTKRDKRAWTLLSEYARSRRFEGHIAGDEFYHQIAYYSQHRLQIVPKKNMISNIGATDDSAHARDINLLPKRVRSQFNSPVYELEFPLKHPSFVIPDQEYARKRDLILRRNHPFLKQFDNIEAALRMIRSGRYNELKQKIRSKVPGDLKEE